MTVSLSLSIIRISVLKGFMMKLPDTEGINFIVAKRLDLKLRVFNMKLNRAVANSDNQYLEVNSEIGIVRQPKTSFIPMLLHFIVNHCY